MRLSRLYSNKPDVFEPIEFRSGLNVVLGEIRLPENRKKDTHNLGKTTLGSLIDFCLLAGRDPRFFLFRHQDLFNDFVFYIEVELLDGTYVTISRSVEQASKISFKKHLTTNEDFVIFETWDHEQVPFERARSLLDGVLSLEALKPWDFRKGLGYFVRSQNDFRDIFRLDRFRAVHSDWKPYLAHLLGFDSKLINEHYEKEEQLADKVSKAETIRAELGSEVPDISKIDGMLLLKRKDVDDKQKFLDSFDFRANDKRVTKQLVDDIDTRIATLNNLRYSLVQTRKKVMAALNEGKMIFDPDEAQQVFKEAGILFEGQIKRDFEQLLEFNKAITEERQGYLQEERAQIDAELKEINSQLTELGKDRSKTLSYLTDTDIFNRYKTITNDLVNLKADIKALERQRGFLLRLQELRKDIRNLTEEKQQLRELIEDEVQRQHTNTESLFSTIRLYFSEIVEKVIDRKAVLSVPVNQEGHLEFRADILDESGNTTSAAAGHTYKKLLCIAFDMAVTRAYLDKAFPRFLFHDGVFESLDDRKKQNLLDVIREYCDLGIQHTITLIDSDLPNQPVPVFEYEEIVLRLHDEGQHGRLFKMRAW